MTRCPACGFPLDRQKPAAICPKCDTDLARTVRSKPTPINPAKKHARPGPHKREPLVVDLAHGGETLPEAMDKLERAVSECLWRGYPVLKVIHGHGSRGGRAVLKPHILSALHKYATRHGGHVLPDGDNPGAHFLSFS